MQGLNTFLHSEMGLYLGIIMALVGFTDLAFGWYMLRRRPELFPVPEPLRSRLIMMLFFLSSFLMLCGLYVLSLRL